MDWDEMGAGLVKDAPALDEHIPLLTDRTLPRLIDQIMPALDPQRKHALKDRIQARVQKKRNSYRAAETERKQELKFNARRLTRAEKRELKREKNALKRLKALLRSG